MEGDEIDPWRLELDDGGAAGRTFMKDLDPWPASLEAVIAAF